MISAPWSTRGGALEWTLERLSFHRTPRVASEATSESPRERQQFTVSTKRLHRRFLSAGIGSVLGIVLHNQNRRCRPGGVVNGGRTFTIVRRRSPNCEIFLSRSRHRGECRRFLRIAAWLHADRDHQIQRGSHHRRRQRGRRGRPYLSFPGFIGRQQLQHSERLRLDVISSDRCGTQQRCGNSLN